MAFHGVVVPRVPAGSRRGAVVICTDADWPQHPDEANLG